MLASLRQLLYPKEFRIAAPKWAALSEALVDMISLLKPAPSEIETSSGQSEGLLNLLVDIGTVVWRLQGRLPTDQRMPEQIRRISRDLESTWDALRQGGFEIKDHTGERYDGGMALRVIAFQPTPGLLEEQVIETLRPTIYHNDRMVQMGQVIVGVPEVDRRSGITDQK